MKPVLIGLPKKSVWNTGKKPAFTLKYTFAVRLRAPILSASINRREDIRICRQPDLHPADQMNQAFSSTGRRSGKHMNERPRKLISFDQPHRRFNPLTGDWVLVSPHRTQRPWQGKVEKLPERSLPEHEPSCYLCPGNLRASGERNPDYTGTYVFTNDFAALRPDVPELELSPHPLIQARSVRGTSRVLCFSPRHDLSLARMAVEDIVPVINMWAEQMEVLGQDYRWVQIFENRGEMMGSSMPHPHGQIWASDQLPNEVDKEDRHQANYFQEHGKALLIDYLAVELEAGERLVIENRDWAALVPFWAIWPFEILLLPKEPVQYLQDLNEAKRRSLAMILKQLLIRYDNLFETSFPYSMGWHPAPNDSRDHHGWQLHAHFYPPLLRSATVKKFLVGYEMLAEAQRDITAEQAAEQLRAQSNIHYLLGG
jgi:UDPglucose--hexose-1-phosphate uridylyltransferase